MKKIITLITFTLLGVFFWMLYYDYCYDYNFKSEEKIFPWGKLGARLEGTINEGCVIGSPYTLFVWIDKQSNSNTTIIIDNLELINNKTGTVLFHKTNIKQSKNDESSNERSSLFWFRGLDLEFQDMLMTINFTFKEPDANSSYSATIHFQMNYIEEFRPAL